jgi:hypothetical protein
MDAFTALAGSEVIVGSSSRYLQYQAQLTTTVPGQTATLQDVTIEYSTGGS